MLEPFDFPQFRLLWGGFTVSSCGTWMQMLALGWLVVQLAVADGHPQLGAFYLGLVAAARSIPSLFVSLVAGAVADRTDRRGLLITTNLSGAVVAAAMAGLVLLGHMTILWAVVLSALGAVAVAFDGAARQATLPRLVPRNYLSSAIGLNLATNNLAIFIGPMIGGLLIGPLGVGGLLALNAGSYAFIVGALLAMTPIPVEATPGQSILESVREGFAYVYRHHVIRPMFAVLAVVSLGARPLQQMLPAVTRDVLHAGPVQLSWLLAASGVGAVIGSIAGPYFARLSRIGISTALAASSFGALTLVFALQRSLPLALLLVAAASVGQGTHVALHMTIYQTRTPDALRGRVVASSMMIPITLAPLGALLLGALGSWLGISTALVLGGAAAAAAGLVVLAANPVLRRTTNAEGQDTVASAPAAASPAAGGRSRSG